VSDTTVEEGDCVTYRVSVDGGDSPFEYDWNGDLEGEDDDEDETIRVCYDDEGDYEVTIVVEDDDGNRESDTCEIEVDNDNGDDDDRDVNVFNDRDDDPSGTLASVDAVYLSQIPYTGPAETAALVATGLAVLGLGFGAAVALKKRSMRKETADRIAAFKAANLAKKVA
jgi:LPXTG-motif cell wall-anchored protein